MKAELASVLAVRWWSVPLLVVLFFVLDVVCFRAALWHVPDETAWDTAHLYHYEYTARRLARETPAGRTRIIVTGSSIARYGVLPSVLAEGLRARGIDRPRVELLSIQGMHPGHLLASTGRLLSARPDLIVLPLGFVDFRPERPLVLGLMDDLDGGGPRRAAALGALRRDLYRDPRFRVLAPGVWARRFHDDLTTRQVLSGWIAEAVAAYRYRAVLGTPILTNFRNRFSRGRSYHHYAGIPVGGGNVHHRGWTGTRFEVSAAPLVARGLWVEAPPELFAAARAKGRRPVLYIGPSGGPEKDVILRPGWQRLAIPNPVTPATRLAVRVEPGWDSPLLADRLGVRLASRAGRRDFRRREREIRREDEMYTNYTEAEYRASYERRIRGFERRGMEYLQSLEQARAAWADRPFDEELPAFRSLSTFLDEMRKVGVPVLIVLAPENPLATGDFEGRDWFRGYRAFLERSSGREPLDPREGFTMRDFYDHHHLTYFGAERMSRRLVDAAARALRSP